MISNRNLQNIGCKSSADQCMQKDGNNREQYLRFVVSTFSLNGYLGTIRKDFQLDSFQLVTSSEIWLSPERKPSRVFLQFINHMFSHIFNRDCGLKSKLQLRITAIPPKHELRLVWKSESIENIQFWINKCLLTSYKVEVVGTES